jgi:acyl-CoA thioesterase I
MVTRICFVGDSYVAGTGDPECLGWVGRACRTRWRAGDPVTWYNLGIRGDTSACIERRWRLECEARVGPHNSGRLVFSFGINDGAVDGVGRLRLSQTASLHAARRIIAGAAKWLPTIWIGPPPANEPRSPMSPLPGVSYSFSNDRLLALNYGFKRLAGELDVAYLDIATSLSGSARYQKSLVGGDGMHCSSEGYDMIAEMVEGWEPWGRLCRFDGPDEVPQGQQTAGRPADGLG